MFPKELLSRESDGVKVGLFWNSDSKNNPAEPSLIVDVLARGLPSFTIACETLDEAREAYAHPYASLNRALKSGRVIT
jgi:hypothetical protein